MNYVLKMIKNKFIKFLMIQQKNFKQLDQFSGAIKRQNKLIIQEKTAENV